MRREGPGLAKHYLINWAYYDQNFSLLSNTEKVKMKILYSILKDLTHEELEILKAKYRVKRSEKGGAFPRPSDGEAAANIGISEKAYTKRRIKIERSLWERIDAKSDDLKEEYKQAEEQDDYIRENRL